MVTEPNRIEEVFTAALQRKAGPERAAYLHEACRNDVAMRERVEALLAASDAAGEFLQKPVLGGDLVSDKSVIVEGPGTVIGRYTLLERIGEGGMAVVYMAEQQHPIRRRVALKIIKLGMDTRQVVARFEVERQALAMMDHPNIARVFDAGATETGRPYFVMELVRGVPITEYCDRHRLNTRARLELFIRVCHAVEHAHQKDIIHRDLKPSNVMVTVQDGRPTPKVIDFGIAKATSQKLTEKTLFTRYAHIIGTPAYMSPEQAAFDATEVDVRTDVYSLGVLLYELLTGTTPFGERQLREAGYAQMQRIICEEEPTRPSSKLGTSDALMAEIAAHQGTTPNLLRKLLRRDLDWIVMKCLEKDRACRYVTAAELAADVRRHLNHEPIQAVAPSVSYRFCKFARRHHTAVAMVALVTGATLMGATVAKFVVWPSPGSMGKDEHAARMVMRHVWNVPPRCSLAGALSSDGRYLPYVDWTAGNLGVYDLTAETSWLVTRNTDSTWMTIDGWVEEAVVSPDGAQIAYSWCNQKGVDFYDLRIIDPAGTSMRVLYHDARTFWIKPYAWSPDGKNILAYFSDAEKNLVDERTGQLFRRADLVSLAVADGSVRVLKTWHEPSHPATAVFSPDGRYVAYDFGRHGDPDRHDIFLLALDSGRDITLVEHAADDRLFGWTPDGTKIVFASDRTAKRGVWMIGVADGTPQGPAELLKGELDGSPICFTADGSFYYGVNTTASNVYVAGLDSTGVEFEEGPRLVSSRFVGSTSAGVWSPDGRFLAYRRDAGARDWVFVICSMETSEERIITPSPPFRVGSIMRGPWWSPDAQSLLVCGFGRGGGLRLHTIDVLTGAAAPIAGSRAGSLERAVWSPDGQSLYVRGGTRLSRLDPATGGQTALYEGPESPMGLDISRDGRWLAFYMGLTSLAVLPSVGGEPREVVHVSQDELNSHAFVTWTPDGQYLLFCKNVGELWRVHVETRGPHHIATVNGELLSAAMHPDGRQIAFTVQQAGSQLWVMENFLPGRKE